MRVTIHHTCAHSNKTREVQGLHSEDIPPPPHDYPYYWRVHIGSQDKTRQSQNYKFKESTKTNVLNLRQKHCTRQTFWSYLIRCKIWNESGEYCGRYIADTILSTDGQTDGRTDRRTGGEAETSIPPSISLSVLGVGGWVGGGMIMILPHWPGYPTRGAFY